MWPDEDERSEPWLRGRWLRRRYFVEDELIKPVPTSKLELYDLFANYRAETTKNVEEPDERLVTHLANLDAGNRTAVEAFTAKWGLLGLFQHDLYQVRYVPTNDGWVQPLHDPPMWAPLKTVEIWEGPDFRFAVTFDLEFKPWHVPRDAVEDVLAAQGLEAVSPTEDPVAWEAAAEEAGRRAEARWKNDPDKRGAVITTGPGGGYREKPLLDYFSPFFPDLSGWPAIPQPFEGDLNGRFSFPSMHTEEVWDYLCEPLVFFRMAVSEFQRTARLCAEVRGGQQDQATQGGLRRTFARHLRRGHPTLEWLDEGSGAVSAVRSRKRGTAATPPGSVAAWSFSSLLSAAYLMLLFDFTQMFPKHCKSTTCRRLFVASNEKRRYCSARCLNQQKQRTARGNAKRQRDEGGS